jgi:hypothetical protein
VPIKTESASAGGRKIFDFGNWTLALDGNREPGARLQPLHAYNLALTQESDGMAQSRSLHGHRQAHARTNRNRIVNSQEQTADAYVPADSREFPDRTSGGKTEYDGEFEIESAVPALFLLGRVEILEEGHKRIS